MHVVSEVSMSWDTNLDRVEDDGERAKQYRARAAELRAVAEWMKEPPAVTQMLATALEYERMAQTVEKISTTKADLRARMSRVSVRPFKWQ
jgi:hypothetical protein